MKIATRVFALALVFSAAAAQAATPTVDRPRELAPVHALVAVSATGVATPLRCLDDAAPAICARVLAAVGTWSFVPADLRGTPLDAGTRVTVGLSAVVGADGGYALRVDSAQVTGMWEDTTARHAAPPTLPTNPRDIRSGVVWFETFLDADGTVRTQSTWFDQTPARDGDRLVAAMRASVPKWRFLRAHEGEAAAFESTCTAVYVQGMDNARPAKQAAPCAMPNSVGYTPVRLARDITGSLL